MLLQMSFTASIVILFVLILRILLRQMPKIFSYALWLVVLFRLLCPVSFSSQFSIFRILDVSLIQNEKIEDLPIDDTTDINHFQENDLFLPNDVFIDSIQNQVGSPLTTEKFNLYATCIWMIGIIILIAYSSIQSILLHQKLVGVVPLEDNIYLSDYITTPFVMGVIRPKIYLPSSLLPEEQPYILLHEQHHINRGDHITKRLFFLALCIHWFNPLVWIAFLLAGNDMEMSCDEAIMRTMNMDIRAEYATTLLRITTGTRRNFMTSLSFGEDNVKGRVKNIMNYKKHTNIVMIFATLFFIVMSIILITNPSNPENNNNLSSEFEESDSNTAPTGYPADEIQNQYVMIAGNLYVTAGSVREKLPEDYIYYGKTTVKLTTAFPTNDLEGTQIATGTAFYYNPNDKEQIYKQENDFYRLFRIFLLETTK